MSAFNSTRTDTSLPRIAIVGRPNVGKSTLFNRMIRARRSITDPTPGVTRDALEASFHCGGIATTLVDTGGFTNEDGDFDRLVADRCVAEIERAHLVLCVIDVVEVTAEDEDLLEVVRAKATDVILVINKVDNEKREMDVWNHYSLGFDTVVSVSAEHNLNIDELEREITKKLISLDPAALRKRDVPERADIRLALLGKPNTGKSTLLNYLLDNERSIVSSIPGTTRDVIEGAFSYKSRRFSVVDTAGIRRKRMVHESVEYYSVNRALRSIEESDIVLLVVDAIEGLVEQDKKIATQVIRHGKGVVILLNKWDLVEPMPNAENAIRDRTRFIFPILSFAPLLPISAKTGEGIPKVLDMVVQLDRELQTRISTGQLNRALQEWSEQHPIPHGGGPKYAARYMTQISSAPLEFVLFVNRKKGFPASWVSYLKNRMRETFNITHVTFNVELRES